jgi:hypothetical protein
VQIDRSARAEGEFIMQQLPRTSGVPVPATGWSGGVGFEPDGAEVVSAGEADACVEGSGEVAQEGDGGLRAAFLDALDVVGQIGP